MKLAVARLGGSACWWMRFSWLLLPRPPLGSRFQCPDGPAACFTFSSELVLLCHLSKCKQITKKGIFYQWFCESAFGGLCLGYVGDLGVPGASSGQGWGWGGLREPPVSAGLQPCNGSLGTRHDALSTLSTAGSSTPCQVKHSCTKRNTCILTVKLSVLAHRTDGIVLLIECMLLNALKKIGTQNYEGRLV